MPSQRTPSFSSKSQQRHISDISELLNSPINEGEILFKLTLKMLCTLGCVDIQVQDEGG